MKTITSVGCCSFLFVMVIALPFILTSSPPSNVLYRGGSLSVERSSADVLISEQGTFKAGFYQVGENAFSFAIWFSETLDRQKTVIWMANRDWPVKSRGSRLSLRKRGNLALLDADASVVWATATTAAGVVAELWETGNLVLLDGERRVVWQSFDHSTDTLLPGQPLTRSLRLVSRAGEGIYTTGYYVAHFNDDNVLSFIYDGPNTSSIYWPSPYYSLFQNGRTSYNSSRYAILDDMGRFTSSDSLKFSASDFGLGVKRRLTMDLDGILRLYSLNHAIKDWESPRPLRRKWHLFLQTKPHMHLSSWFSNERSYSRCKPEFDIVCNKTEVNFIKLPHTDFYGYDLNYRTKVSFEACQNICKSDCNCRGFGYRLDGEGNCYPKSILFSGNSGPHFEGDMYVKIPIQMNFIASRIDHSNLDCPKVYLPKVDKAHGDYLKYPLGFVIAFGIAEIMCVTFGWVYFHKRTINLRNLKQGYVAVTMGFRSFTFEELKEATNNFSDEIGRGGSGVVYKGVLEDKRVVAVKKLEGLSHRSEAQFWSEVSTIGRINHMNLVTMFGFCAEKQRRLLVYEYLENGSLEKNLFSNSTMLTWESRYNIALGTAKALAYLHEECLEWVLHCEVKPHNVLLDKNFLPKVADFGLSKLLDRRGNNISEFSRARGTRGYMAPEWILNLPITSKVDVYSYGILVLELVTGRISTGFQQIGENGEVGNKQLISWITEMVRTDQNWVEEIVDPQLSGMYNRSSVEILIKVALQCIEKKREGRPTMSQVVDSITVACPIITSVGCCSIFFVMVTALPFILASSPPSNVLYRGGSLSVERSSADVLISEQGTFKAGFYQVGENAFSFAIWFSETLDRQKTVVWMANRDLPVNSRGSRLSFRMGGDLALLDADDSVVWMTVTTTTNTNTNTSARAGEVAELWETGNLRRVVWQSFDHPTDTLLPEQPLTRSLRLVSRAAEGIYSSGYYSAHFNDDNVLSFIYDGPNTSSIYWPYTDRSIFQNGMTSDNSSRYAILDDMGRFTSSDRLKFSASDFGLGVKRRLTMDIDGILRLYSLNHTIKDWEVSWMPVLERCRVHGLCGENGICVYRPSPTCTCPHGFEIKVPTDWTQGCKPEFNIVCNRTEVKFIKLPHTDFYGYDLNNQTKVSFEACQNICKNDCNCRGFGYRLDGEGNCYPKSILLSGQSGSHFLGDMYITIPKQENLIGTFDQSNVDCSKVSSPKKVDRAYAFGKALEDYLKYPIGFVIAFGVAELICVAFGWFYIHKKTVYLRNLKQGYVIVSMGFRRFTFEELKKATNNFGDEIGRGGSGVVYKGVLDDKRVVAVKKLEGLSHGSEAQFWSEVSIIGRINHMNLVTMFGFCAEKQKRLLVYEYLENGSLEKNLFSIRIMLTWENRYNIALGTAKALAYLHEECLEWVIHCEVKPHNVLLDKSFQPKVADFGLSKLFDRGGNNISEFSRVRGTRGYMAPEWILNLPITSKVDVYSYGILVLELVTGRNSIGFQQTSENGEGYRQLIPWIREMVRTNQNWVEEIADPQLFGMYDKSSMEILIKVALLRKGCKTKHEPSLTSFSFVLKASSPLPNALYRGSSHYVDSPSMGILISEKGTLKAGLYKVGQNAFSFAIWYAETLSQKAAVIRMANRYWPVNRRASRLFFRKGGNLALLDADGNVVWMTATTATNTKAGAGVVAELWETGNLVLLDGERRVSFEHPTDMLLPAQPLTRSLRLVSRRAEGIYSSGYHVAHFNDDNVLSFIYDGPYTSSVYWPNADYDVFQNRRIKYKKVDSRYLNQGYVSVGFRRFTFEELKNASNNFSDEIERGGSRVVYKGVLDDKRVVAVKRLEGLSHGSEASKHHWKNQSYEFSDYKRLLVYEYLENGSLEKNLFSNSAMLTWENRFNIVLGTASVLAYLHEECLECVLHCDVKTQNVLLDKDFHPKVADFGLSKLFNRDEQESIWLLEWILNLPITSKVDVYSYGTLVLELVTCQNSTGSQQIGKTGEVGCKQLISVD
ncbi:G-type lectin S-receptor-like serine/threonine-protein kinase [Nymphaea thermarum]|nr:G-type lectin S-receptor-like serine/threonine-protein kinase [Nymphaea thermarum]